MEFKKGDIIKSKINKDVKYEVLKVNPKTLTVRPKDPDFKDLEYTCNKSTFKF